MPRTNAILVCSDETIPSQWTGTTRALRLTWQARLLGCADSGLGRRSEACEAGGSPRRVPGRMYGFFVKRTWTPLCNNSKPFGVLESRRAVSGKSQWGRSGWRWVLSKRLHAPTRGLAIAICARGHYYRGRVARASPRCPAAAFLTAAS